MCTEDKTEKSYIYWNTHEHLDRASGCTTTSALHHMLLFLIGIRILTQNQYQHPTVICCAILILHKRNVRVECEEFQKGCWSVHPSPKPHFKISISISPLCRDIWISRSQWTFESSTQLAFAAVAVILCTSAPRCVRWRLAPFLRSLTILCF